MYNTLAFTKEWLNILAFLKKKKKNVQKEKKILEIDHFDNEKKI